MTLRCAASHACVPPPSMLTACDCAGTLVWHPVRCEGPAPPARASHSCSPLDGDRLLLFGGYNGHTFLNDGWILCAGECLTICACSCGGRPTLTPIAASRGDEVHKWQQLKPRRSGENSWPVPRSGHTITPVGGDGDAQTLVLFGGRHAEGRCNDLLLLDTGARCRARAHQPYARKR